MESKAPVSLQIADGIARIAIDDGKANALNDRSMAEIERAVDQAEAAEAAIVLVGRAGFFSGGLDLKRLPTLEPPAFEAAIDLFTRLMLRVFTFPRPVIAAIGGHAIAGGTVLALGADERIAGQGAFRMGLNETAIGLPLPRFVVEMARAQLDRSVLRRVITAGELFDPIEAERIGLVDRLVPLDALEAEAIARAKVLAALPARAYAENKHVLRAEAAHRGREAWPEEKRAFTGRFTALAR